MLHENNSEPIELERADNGEIKNKIKNEGKNELELESKSYQMPANLVAAEFGEVNVWRNMSGINSEIAECRVEFLIAMEPQGKLAEGWRTGLALDASASMKRSYGRKVEARVDSELLAAYIKQGRLRSYLEDGEPIRKIEREAFAEIQERGYEINYTANVLQPLVQDFSAYLAGSLDGTGKTSLIYWGCGNGDEIQVLGEFDYASCQQLAITGPATFQLGKTTKLLPAITYFVNQYSQAPQGIYIFLTDGRIDDLDQVKSYTRELALEIAVGKRNYLKLVLVGIGNDVDRYQLQELDDFETGLDIDIWDYKIASEMTSISQIFAEVVNEHQIIADSGSIYDDQGNCVKSYTNGLPAKVDFLMRDDSQWFELEVCHQRIRQAVILGTAMAIVPLAKKKLFDFETQAQESYQAVALVNDQVDDEIASSQMGKPSSLWKILAALFIGAAFVGTAIAFGILIKRSDDNKLQNQAVSRASEDSVLESQTDETNKANNNLLDSSTKSSSQNSRETSNPATNLKNNPATKKETNNKLNDIADRSSVNSSDKALDKSSSNNLQNNENNTGKVVGENPKKLAGDISSNASANKSNLIAIANPQKLTGDMALATLVKYGIVPKPKGTQSSAVSQTPDQSYSANNTSAKNNKDNPSKNASADDLNNSKNAAKSDRKIALTNAPNTSTQNKTSDRSINKSILPITNPDVEVVVFFPSDESRLVSNEETKIEDFWTKIQGKRGIIQVSGHTDRMGGYDYNLDLSQARANEVVRLLRDRGLDGNYKVTFEALSWLQPLRKEITAKDNAFNRRVVIQFKELR
ncbi:MAG: OmpA family protein [Pseudanabaena sp.]|jgi:outer membrane protein OmpA-like peptidoglycan-associated protein|nr:OmpA family protein [Pseudanabaena sp. M090S1SP2A07QC]MCA6506414.1 OmpA family protein [Pseudanabaena sp. M172S2SP2A07QC]MCA6520859.1 OmpA family protein [Pseudanabaena sp. M051S1SP2A07QC]MCA6525781.1 OmpA family protein [Pseudanabaena sp. M179S2SP2A07QC]MCA6528663.1 OmpA family protein [Pseudanabaena sp. M125S2SP2A07QC]MCA6536298.1 OmpA family protein [Pseudanabaena sp. M176S2SP2A07QC]MCA6539497.1 OmpA family protein [Pseudanabaena sp. M037S2SP2A07QC]MCA6545707.1 OmpA family protein [Pse